MVPRRAAAVVAFAALVTVIGAGSGPARGQGTPPRGAGTAGPPYPYSTELMGGGAFLSLPDQAALTRTDHGYLYRAGQQDSHLVVTLTSDGIRFADTGTGSFRKLARACREEKAEPGIAAVCPVPAAMSTTEPLLVEVWPRLGDDFLDGSSLPATVAMTMLGDAGHDEALFGAGPDFFNGFTGRDRVSGGGGADWIRTGSGADRVWGGDGDDQLVGTDGRDTFYGEAGDDLVGGGAGNDRLDGGAGVDLVRCEGGTDAVVTDGRDRLRECEVVDRG